MRFLIRGGTLLAGSVAASLFFQACRNVADPEPPVQEPAPAIAEQVGVEKTPHEEELRLPDPESEQPAEPPVEDKPTPKKRGARSLADQAATLGAEARQLDGSDQWEVRKGDRVLLLKEDSRVATLDGIKVFLDTPFRRVKGNWILGESDRRLILAAAFSDEAPPERSIRTIVIDPGHGGNQDGAVNDGLGVLEKDLNLDVSVRLQKRLEEAGYKVALTRYEDRLVELDERPQLSNGLKADLFLSIHFNAAYDKKVHGLETYMLTPEGHPSSADAEAGADAMAWPGNRFDKQNFELAYRIQKSMLNALGREDRGTKKARFRVLKLLDCPGALVECGFVSHEEEALLVSTAGYRERVAKALADAITAYAEGSESNGS